MGANTFGTKDSGKTAQEAFTNAVADAQWEHCHGGYTGTIAEKHSFVVIPVPKGKDPRTFAESLMDASADDPRISDKWGPAGCVRLSENEWYFFGWASS